MDHAATTAVCDEARAAMQPFLAPAGPTGGRHGNPSGSHAIARDAVRALDAAREEVAGVLGCAPGDVVFTSGGTEADNHAVTGGMPPRPGLPVCSAVEHPAVLAPTAALGGHTVAVDRLGRVDLEVLADTLRRVGDGGGPGVSVVSVMLANNELGTANDLDAVAEVVRRHAPGAMLHTDAVQAAAWWDLRDLAASADLVSVSAHKLGGPKGTGALVVRPGAGLRPLLHGGGQERGRRGGTHGVAGIVGLAAALGVADAQRVERVARTSALRDRLADALVRMDGVAETVGPEVAAAVGLRPGPHRGRAAGRSHLLPGHCHLMVDGVGGEELLLLLEQHGVCASAASSCASGALGASHVVEALAVAPAPEGVAVDRTAAPLRLTLGADTTDADVDATIDAMAEALELLRDRPGRWDR